MLFRSKYSMELGGNAPFIVFDDADLDNAINIGAAIKFGNCGQICVAANRFFVHEKVHDKFLNGLIEKAKNLKIGYSEDLDFEIGPLISKKSRDRITNLIKDTIDSGGILEYGGGIPKMNGNWFEPTVISGINESMSIFHEEIFGPVASIIKFKYDEEVLNQANKTHYGLASYLFTKIGRAHV